MAINGLLDQSKPSRGALGRAIAQVSRCKQVGKGISAMQRVTDQRGEQVALAEKLAVDALDGGEALKQSLVDALSASHRADKGYLKWAKRFKASGCGGPTVGDSAYDAGNAASEDATVAKADFVAQWSPIAQREDLPTRTEDEI